MSPKLLENQVEKDKLTPRVSLFPRSVRIGLLAIVTLGATGPVMAARPPSAMLPRNTLSNLTFQERGDTTVIEVTASDRPMFTVYKLDRPPRLTVDLANCSITGIKRLVDVGTWAVSQVATTRFKSTRKSVARIMVNFRRPAHYTVKTSGNRLIISIIPDKKSGRKASPTQREADLSAELGRMQEELRQQKAVAKAAVEAATHLRQVAMAARQRLAGPGSKAGRQEALRDLKQAETKLRQAEQARKNAEAERARLQQSLKQALARTGELERKINSAALSRSGNTIRDIRFVDGKKAARVEIHLHGDAIPPHRVTGSSHQPVLELSGVKLPKLLQRTLDASEFAGPVKQVTSYTRSGRVAIRVTLQGQAPDARVEKVGQTLVWSFPKNARFRASTSKVGARGTGDYTYKSTRVAAARVRRTGRRRRGYHGRRIDLDFKDADLHNILRLISEVGSVNIVTSDKVSGRVTIRMKNVPWDHALDVILRAKGLGQVREGNLVRVAPTSDLEKEREAEIARQKQMLLLRPLETRLMPVSYAQAQDVLPKIQYMMSPRGRLTFDVRTNTVIARDISGNLDLMERLIRSLDTQTPQVLIEARIVEARTNFTKEIGIQWGGSFAASSANGNSTGLIFPNQLGIAGGATDGNTPTTGIMLGQDSNPNFAVNMPAPAGTGAGGALGLTLGSVSGNVNINLRLSALESMGDIRIISAPKITTLDNVQASIEQGVTIPFSQVSAAGVQTTFKDAKLNLTVTPHVTAEGSIMMKVQVTNNEPDFVNTGPRGEPTILKKEAKTEMLIKDGDTTVIGGIYTIRSGTSWSKVPWFAEIPILGWFFRHKKETNDRQEVLVFITPRIVNRAQSIGR